MTTTSAPTTVQTAPKERSVAWQYSGVGYPSFAVWYRNPKTGEDIHVIVRYFSDTDSVKGYLEKRGVDIHDEGVVVEYLGI